MLLLLLFLGTILASNSLPCKKKIVSLDRIVCVCNATYCDDIEPIGTLTDGQAVLIQTTKSGKRLERTVVKSSLSESPDSQITIKLSTAGLQQIMGFGGAFTDSVGYNLLNLPKNMQDMVLSSYYGESGLNYVFGRVPMASTDFSTHAYSYDDIPGDFDLKNFSLTYEDFHYKIPFIKKAQELAKDRLKLITAPWSAPGWMKTNGQMKGGAPLIGEVNGKYYQTWTQYFIKFFEQYSYEGITFWGTSMQNEPMSGIDPAYAWQTMYLTAKMQRDWLKGLFGPALRSNNLTKDINILIMDDQRFNIKSWTDTILNDEEAAKYVSGVGIHWYEDNETPGSLLTSAHNHHPDYFLLYTESCNGYIEHNVILGDWGRAVNYAKAIITDLTNYVSGWVDWNLCLDTKGGPNWTHNNVDAPIIIDKEQMEFYKQPMYYVLAHFSKYVPVGSRRTVDTLTNVINSLEQVSFITPENNFIVVLLNTGHKDITVSIQSPNDSSYYSFVSEKNSISTISIPK